MGSKITEINKETFWQLIEETKNQCGQDMDASISWIKKELLRMPPEQSLQFHAIMHGYRSIRALDGSHSNKRVWLFG